MLLFFLTTECFSISNPQLTLSYWNDNFAYQKQVSSIIPPGDDDFMTASWRIEVLDGDQVKNQGGELYYAIFTNRTELTRFDMLAFRWFKEFQPMQWKYKIGLGCLMRGNFGGSKFQNAFHEWQGYDRVELDYLPRRRIGLLFYGRAARMLSLWKQANLQLYTSTALRVGSGPSNARFGLEYETNQAVKPLPVRWLILLRLGYAYYVQPNQIIEPYFSRGPVAGILFGIQIKQKYAVYTWMTENQYGLHDPHYGLTLSYRLNSLIPPKLHSIMFP